MVIYCDDASLYSLLGMRMYRIWVDYSDVVWNIQTLKQKTPVRRRKLCMTDFLFIILSTYFAHSYCTVNCQGVFLAAILITMTTRKFCQLQFARVFGRNFLAEFSQHFFLWMAVFLACYFWNLRKFSDSFRFQ